MRLRTYVVKLTLFFSMLMFSFNPPENRNPLVFRCFQGNQKGTLGRKVLKVECKGNLICSHFREWSHAKCLAKKKNAVFSSCWFVQFVWHVKLTEQYSRWEIVFTRSLTLVKNNLWNALFISWCFLWNLSGIIHLVSTQNCLKN